MLYFQTMLSLNFAPYVNLCTLYFKFLTSF
uniref:Uncharacterized protein n=1 Tax=Arundo donax TaxID=35708 RepID=A0A0A9FEN5_ARUDO